MSCGLMVCSKCKREVHQGCDAVFPPNGWYHCRGTRWEADGPMCAGASPVYPERMKIMKMSIPVVYGPYCGLDEL